jgi:predicted NAD/FAD-dependent oxidoreductase
MAAARFFSQAGHATEVWEKSRGVSGRAGTRTRHGSTFDFGANFFKLDDPEVAELVQHQLPAAELARIDGDVWIVDEHGAISAGDPRHNAEPKWTYRHGIKTLAKLLHADAFLAELHVTTRIAELRPEGGRWWLVDEEEVSHGPYEQILLTPPAPQTAALLRSAGLEEEPVTRALEGVHYHRQFTFVLGFDEVLARSLPFHALVNLDGRYEVAWMSYENDKPGHVADGCTVVVVQMAPPWSDERYGREPEALLPEVLESLRRVLPDPLPDPAWWDWQRWGCAHPTSAADAKAVRSAEDRGVFVAGDALVGKGRVTQAVRTGLAVARRMSGLG